MSIIPPFKYRDNIPKVQLFEDLGSLTGIPFAQPEDIKGLDKGLSQILGEAGGFKEGQIYDRRFKNILRPTGEALELLYGGIGSLADLGYKPIRGGLKYLFGKDPRIAEAQETTPEGIDLATIPDSGVGRPDFVPDDLPIETDITKPGVTFQGLAPLIEGKDAPPSAEDDYELGTGFQSVAEQMKNLQDKKTKQLYAGQEGRLTKEEPDAKGEGEKKDKANVSKENSFESLFNASMSSYLASQGQEDTGKKTIDDYKKDFEDATGISASGEVDKSSALMALGLALMQNKAGKGFNVGNMLSAVGEAGEKALPAFEKAKQEAKLGAAKAGEYALGKVAEDDAKAEEEKKEMLDRSEYYIIPRGDKDPKSMAQNFAKGQFKRLNKYELNNLITNKEFSEKYEVLSGELYGDAFAEALKPPEAKDTWLTTPRTIKLFEEAPEEFQIDVMYTDPNSGISGARPAAGTDYLYTSFEQGEKRIQKMEQDFSDIIAATKAGGGPGLSLAPQFGALMDKAVRAFGVNVGADLNPINKAKAILTRLQATNASAILQETGKTLSDADRELVKEIVGKITMKSLDGLSEDQLLQKLSSIYDLTVGKSRRNLESARAKLKSIGITIPTRQAYADKFTETDKIVGIS